MLHKNRLHEARFGNYEAQSVRVGTKGPLSASPHLRPSASSRNDERKNRLRSASPEPRFWPEDWATNHADFRNALKNFEHATAHFSVPTPPETSESSLPPSYTTKNLPRSNISGDNTGQTGSFTDRADFTDAQRRQLNQNMTSIAETLHNSGRNPDEPGPPGPPDLPSPP